MHTDRFIFDNNSILTRLSKMIFSILKTLKNVLKKASFFHGNTTANIA